jgi:hypothetical protein
MLQSVQASHIRVLQMFLSQRQITLSYRHRSYKYLVQEKSMSNEQKNWEFKVEDIFEDIPGDETMMNMKIPDEIMEKQGWKPGDTMKISWGDKGTIIIEKVKENDVDS